MTRTHKPVSERASEAFARPITDQVVDLERDFDVFIDWTIAPGAQKGVLDVRLEAYAVEDVKRLRPLAAVQHTWPDAGARTLPVIMYQQTISLAHLLHDNWLDRQFAEQKPRQRRGGR